MVSATTRPAAVAGLFYPADPRELASAVDGFLRDAPHPAGPPPKALIVPHAGYVYSGPIAGSAYALLEGARGITRVVLVGPAHRVPVRGMVWPGTAKLATPLGDVEVDVAALAKVPQVAASPRAHAQEHCLEVQLPFLRRVLPGARVVPILVGDAEPGEVGAVLDTLWGGPETLILVSSDLSHYLPYDLAREVDGETAARIEDLSRFLEPEQACGAHGINGLIWVAARRGLRARRLDLRSSGDTAGDRSRVVGYGAFAFDEVDHAARH